jgi:hypothetical protein
VPGRRDAPGRAHAGPASRAPAGSDCRH